MTYYYSKTHFKLQKQLPWDIFAFLYLVDRLKNKKLFRISNNTKYCEIQILKNLGRLTHTIGDSAGEEGGELPVIDRWAVEQSCEPGIGKAWIWEYANKSLPKK